MGLFTTIKDPETGLEVQIKVGGDSMNTYKIGEIINELNGCYPALGRDKEGELVEYWVVVKESRALAIRRRDSCLEEDLRDEFDIEEP